MVRFLFALTSLTSVFAELITPEEAVKFGKAYAKHVTHHWLWTDEIRYLCHGVAGEFLIFDKLNTLPSINPWNGKKEKPLFPLNQPIEVINKDHRDRRDIARRLKKEQNGNCMVKNTNNVHYERVTFQEWTSADGKEFVQYTAHPTNPDGLCAVHAAFGTWNGHEYKLTVV